jgi:hypothetical protein
VDPAICTGWLVPPDGTISHTYFGRSFLGQWLNPEASDLLFKLRYEQFRKRWSEAFDWDLFKPLKAADAHYLGTLHTPSDGNQADFDNQTMALAKVLIERLNEAELAQRIKVGKDDKGIAKLEKYLAAESFTWRTRDWSSCVTCKRFVAGLRTSRAQRTRRRRITSGSKRTAIRPHSMRCCAPRLICWMR